MDLYSKFLFDIAGVMCIITDQNGNIIAPNDIEAISKMKEIIKNNVNNNSVFSYANEWYEYFCMNEVKDDNVLTIQCIKNITKEKNREIDLLQDKKTGLSNEMHTYELFDEFLEDVSGRNNIPFACLYIDIDYFKSINDTYNHEAGDKVLTELGTIIKRYIRKRDIAGRIGGDEFFVVLKNIDENNAVRKAEQIRNDFNKKDIYYENQKINVLGTSIGIYHLNSSDIDFDNNESIKEIRENIKCHADTAMYESKQEGKNRVTIIKKNLTRKRSCD